MTDPSSTTSRVAGVPNAGSAHAARLAKVRRAMDEAGLDALLLSLGADLPWLTGSEAMPLERLTMLVVPANDLATLVVPRLEAPRVAIAKAFRRGATQCAVIATREHVPKIP